MQLFSKKNIWASHTHKKNLTYQSFHKAASESSHLLEVPIHVEDTVFLAQLDVGIDSTVHAGSSSAVTNKKNVYIKIYI